MLIIVRMTIMLRDAAEIANYLDFDAYSCGRVSSPRCLRLPIINRERSAAFTKWKLDLRLLRIGFQVPDYF